MRTDKGVTFTLNAGPPVLCQQIYAAKRVCIIIRSSKAGDTQSFDTYQSLLKTLRATRNVITVTDPKPTRTLPDDLLVLPLVAVDVSSPADLASTYGLCNDAGEQIQDQVTGWGYLTIEISGKSITLVRVRSALTIEPGLGKTERLPFLFTPSQLQDLQHMNIEAAYPYTSLGLGGIVLDRKVTKVVLSLRVTDQTFSAIRARHAKLIQAIKEHRTVIETNHWSDVPPTQYVDQLIENIPIEVVSVLSRPGKFGPSYSLLDSDDTLSRLTLMRSDIQIDIDIDDYRLVRTKQYASGTKVLLD